MAIAEVLTTLYSGVVRVRLKRKLNEAVQLVATRGADVDPQTGKIIFKQAEALESKWLLRGSCSVNSSLLPLVF
jgi:hypothetical protein